MKFSRKIEFVSLSIALLFTFLVEVSGSWPGTDQPPPIRDDFNALVDFTKIPPAPVRSNETLCPETDTYCNFACTGCVNGDITVCPNPRDWGLTFDDGPTTFTIDLLNYLKPRGLKITFFVVGSRVAESPEILKMAYDLGHEIGVHTWSHPYLTTQSNEQIIAELQWTAEIIKATIGVIPAYMRPPFGDVDDRVRNIASQLGYKVVIWDRDTKDWTFTKDLSFDFNWIKGNFTEWVQEKPTTGHISLQHDLYNQTASQGPKVVPIVLGANYTIKSVASCIGDNDPYQRKKVLNNPPKNNFTSVSQDQPTLTTVIQESTMMTTNLPVSTQTFYVTNVANNQRNFLNYLVMTVNIYVFVHSVIINSM
ncbi:2844_t:CDS:2 [Acaulospora morrowiae]|uniref:chitin deacetylase n=1 Tax=Acaulospora morrowiae TaxID=94023 RepID=A0A9N9GXT8_9GLOM|nr:2844_t:CDS:2 [Acaulospora morrowiae]